MSKTKLKKILSEGWWDSLTGTVSGWAKDFYYTAWQDEGKVINFKRENGWTTRGECYAYAKKHGYKYFKWDGSYFNVSYAGSIKEEAIAYQPGGYMSKLLTPWMIQVNMWKPLQKPGMEPGHIECKCLNSGYENYQVNPWDEHNDIWVKIKSTPETGNYDNRPVLKSRPDYGGQHIVVYLTNEEFENYKKIAGNVLYNIDEKIAKDILEGKATEKGTGLVYSSITHYNLLQANCADGVAAAFGVSSDTPNPRDFIKNFGMFGKIRQFARSPLVSIINIGNKLGIGTPSTTWRNIKTAYEGRFQEGT